MEVRFRKEVMRLDDVEKFVEKVSKFEDWRLLLHAGKRLWFFSRSGFDEHATRRLRDLGILHSDLEGFNALCRKVEIGQLPMN